MDVLANAVHMLMLSMVVLLPVLVLPDPEAHVLPLAVLQAIVGPVSVCPASSRRLKPQCIQRAFLAMACDRNGIGDEDEGYEGSQPFRSMQLVMVDSVRAGELSRTHF